MHDYLIYNDVTVFGHSIGSILSISQRSATLTAVTVLTIVWKCLVPFLSFVSVSSFIILLHALMRDPKHLQATHGAQIQSDEEDFDEERVTFDRGDII